MTNRILLAFALVACGSHHTFADGDDGGLITNEDGSTFMGSQVDCAAQNKPPTTIRGTVFDPAGKRPIYDVVVYVPSAPLDPFPSGVTCDKCGVLTSGSPVVTTLTDAAGRFVLENAPAGTNIPLVFQIGKWRRQVTVPNVTACTDNALNDPNVTRLPRNKGEGDMPQIAITMGAADPFECLLRKIGIDDAEFTNDQNTGRVHVFEGEDINTHVHTPALPGVAPATALWSNLAKMKQYDVIINACEGKEAADEKPHGSLQNFIDYANAGGRTFNTHYHYYWLEHGVAPLPATADWLHDNSVPSSTIATIDTSFPKGNAFAQWLVNVGASPSMGQLPLTQPKFDATIVHAPGLRWIYGTRSSSQDTLFHYTFNTPIGTAEDQQCGKVLFSDFHVEEPKLGLTQLYFPAECVNDAMTPQDLALEFMLFDLSSCIQKDTDPPKPPPPH